MADKKLFWIKKKSVVKIDGVSYDDSQPLPINKLDKDFLEENIKLGNIGEKIQKTEILSNSAKDEIENLRAENAKLKEEIKSLKKKKKGKDEKPGEDK